MDLNLLRVLDALLQENSVTAAAERLATSPPAVSRSLGRLRRITGDALLVRAGQGLVPTPRAVQIRDELGGLLRRADQILRPGAEFDPGKLQRTFTVQAAELFLTALAVPLLERLRHDAPGVNVVFAPEAREDTGALRRGDIDIELGSLDHLDPETRRTPVAMVPMVGVAAQDHPLFERPIIDAGTFATYGHISVSRRGKLHGPIDEALARHGLRRRVPVVVPSHTSAMLLARSSRLIALTVAGSVDTAGLGVRMFDIPLELPAVAVGVAWHPRNDDDAAHAWLRDVLIESFARLPV
ncbi:LysR family transcriptional regulator [Mycobacteroides abscessus subsp. abscessus]|uniref:LysR family transcriptional regulator n=1 Tax=Mycobacteroides abscessus TaxID=36809 RepID=UPI0003032DA8|nr:LysR family transcriptional regulator [Mycobacteroides abscessus]AWG52405.1 LysR family transcriptional regulator [Mycobacteroides abscessus]MDO3097382.1 LysR family transcriptional regulator [Mycobacteroides abscessus subsp. abscessus]MDO3188079.1 LysR family transcriptional regulator [Mycobacteroides abscessus subsp. abscessus]MDO3190179.1 LysR family transcriptional regulator [Mycobacteroides abscessus subsp. abscessus]MDO3284676.1 LysR family transcriptional regulator [Mycobacteroides a